VVVFPNCKINLGLQIKGKRTDGFHDLETIFFPVPIMDALEVVHSTNGETSLAVSGMQLDAHAEDNICMKAYRLLQQQFPNLAPVQIHLHKNIPSGAGLGGGSADGAFMLKLLNRKFNLSLSDNQLATLALQLGSDCPFFIFNKPCFAIGRGEVLEPISLDLSKYALVLINPRIHINTGWAFGQLPPERKHGSIPDIIKAPVQEWPGALINDFEQPVFAAYPEIAAIKEQLYAHGAFFAAMTGTGATVYGLFKKEVVPPLSFPEHYFVRTLEC
jgi:4-diphosphocytidyl-2-C-methyl-D-erythritol kinase